MLVFIVIIKQIDFCLFFHSFSYFILLKAKTYNFEFYLLLLFFIILTD